MELGRSSHSASSLVLLWEREAPGEDFSDDTRESKKEVWLWLPGRFGVLLVMLQADLLLLLLQRVE